MPYINYVEFNVGNVETSRRFYADVFDWHPQPFGSNDSNESDYLVASHGNEAGIDTGITPSPDGEPLTVAVITVDDIAGYMAKVIVAGEKSWCPDSRSQVSVTPATSRTPREWLSACISQRTNSRGQRTEPAMRRIPDNRGTDRTQLPAVGPPFKGDRFFLRSSLREDGRAPRARRVPGTGKPALQEPVIPLHRSYLTLPSPLKGGQMLPAAIPQGEPRCRASDGRKPDKRGPDRRLESGSWTSYRLRRPLDPGFVTDPASGGPLSSRTHSQRIPLPNCPRLSVLCRLRPIQSLVVVARRMWPH